MPWMRVSIGVGGLATVAGVAGMLLWIHDGSHYFDLAVAVAMAGFLTLVSCVLTRVFSSSHGSQDDAFRRGQSMGYDEGFLEGHRSARPVVVPLRSVDRELEATVSAVKTAAEPEPQAPTTVTATGPGWHRDSRDRADRRGQVIPWMRTRRIPLLVGVVSLAMLCALGISELRRPAVHTEALQQSPGKLFYQAVPPLGSTPALVRRTGRAPARVAAVAGVSPVAPPVASGPSVLPAGESVSTLGLPADATAPGTFSKPVLASSGTAPVVAPAVEPVTPVTPVEPVVAAPVVPLTAAEQTAADAKAAADLTAANAAAAAAETARVAAAAAEATRLQALADAYAVAHPAG